MDNNLDQVKVVYKNNTKIISFDIKIEDFILRIKKSFNIYNSNIKLFAILKNNENNNLKLEIISQNNLDDFYSTDEFLHFEIEEEEKNFNENSNIIENLKSEIEKINTKFENYKNENNNKINEIKNEMEKQIKSIKKEIKNEMENKLNSFKEDI